MSTHDNPEPSDEMIDALLAMEGVQELLVRAMKEYGLDYPLDELPRDARAKILLALMEEGIIQVNKREMSGPEFLEMLEAEEAAEQAKARNYE